MLTLRALRKLCIHGVISTETYWTLKKMRRKKTRRRASTRFTLNAFSKKKCTLLFRFYPEEIRRLLKAFQIPDLCKLVDGEKFSGLEGMCILLKRLAYPSRLTDLQDLFNRKSRSISKIFIWMVRRIYNSHGYLLQSIKQPWMTNDTFLNFANSCSNAGSLFPNIIGFIDGTSRPICRPKRNQREQYSGYKKQHVVKYQSIVFPNGMIGRLDGPFNGRRHDAAILHLSNLIPEFKRFLVSSDGTWFTLFGDPGYSNQKFIKVGYKNYRNLNAAQKLFNADMSALRVSVEYGFGKILQQFAYLDFKKNQKLLLQQLKKEYWVAAILTNCHTCLRGSQVAQYFDCAPPVLEIYLE